MVFSLLLMLLDTDSIFHFLSNSIHIPKIPTGQNQTPIFSGCWPQTIPDNRVGDSALGAEENRVNVKCEPGGSSRPRLGSVWVCWREKERQGCCARRQQGAVLVLMVEERERGGEWAGGKSHLREAGQAATPSSAISWGFSARLKAGLLLQHGSALV